MRDALAPTRVSQSLHMSLHTYPQISRFMFSPSQTNSRRLEGYPRSLITRQVEWSNLKHSYKTVRRGEGHAFNSGKFAVLNFDAATLTSFRC